MHCTIDDVNKLNLRVGIVKEAEPIEGSEKLLRLQVDLGDEVRQVVAGLAKTYPAADLIGQHVIIVANLAPRSIMGVASNGMVLAANDESPVLIAPIQPVPAGTELR